MSDRFRGLLSRAVPGAVFTVLALAALTARTDAGGTATITIDVNPLVAGPQTTMAIGSDAGTIRVDAYIENADSIGSFEFEVLFDPSYVQFQSWTEGPFLKSTNRPTTCTPLISQSTVRIGCNSTGGLPPPSGNGVLASMYFHTSIGGDTCLLAIGANTSAVFGDPLPTDRRSGCFTLAPDSDGDGCTDVEEEGTNPAKGGDRDPLSPWDFYDVPLPAGSPGAQRNRAVNLPDAVGVIYYAGAFDNGPPNANGMDYDADLNSNGTEDGREYDRSASTDPAKPWRSGPPNGAVTISDGLVAMNQVGHICAGLP